jgi:hypothetical protein
MELDPDAESSESSEVVNRLLRLGTVLVVRIDIRGTDDSRSVHDKTSGHWQCPTALAIAHREVIAKAEIDRFEVVRKLEP